MLLTQINSLDSLPFAAEGCPSLVRARLGWDVGGHPGVADRLLGHGTDTLGLSPVKNTTVKR